MLEFRRHPLQMEIIYEKTQNERFSYEQKRIQLLTTKTFVPGFLFFKSYPQFYEKSIVFLSDMRDN